MSVGAIDVSPRKLVLIMAATLAVLAGATWLTLIAPRQSSAGKLAASIADTQTQLASHARTAKAAGGGAGSRLQELRLERALPDVLATPQIVLQLSRIATEEHVSLDSITPAAAVPYSGFTAVPITVVLNGEFPAVEGFVKELRTQVQTGASSAVRATGRLFDVLAVTLQQTTPAPRITATMTVDAFYYTGVPLAPPVSTATTTTAAAST